MDIYITCILRRLSYPSRFRQFEMKNFLRWPTMVTDNISCLWSISDGFSATESRVVSLNGNVYDFSVDYNSIDKSDILNIQRCIMAKNNIK